ncbi:sigma-70 family RNA polymerase sigma factor [Lignipirellula cremea]|uniref:RNA polymerase sigma factor RpoE n=1 Tax=Lignipirellula cremea TaxID=2528010 RepID=A0A518DRN3_9BACT|nr:sigma-70 family RNA polymerase sigma factor [Lignipirellula cremea]QDU94500.1 RNA polymerase sigma factor RpoE [Lignipirellula cremea]
MDTTSVSLLRRLQQPHEETAWQRFVDLYAPLVFHWGKRQGLRVEDAADLVQEVMATLVEKLPQFQYDPQRRFRGWLRTITRSKANDLHRRNKALPQTGQEQSLQNVSAAEGDLFEEAEYGRFLIRQAMMLSQTEFPPHYWQASWKQIVEGLSVAQTARDLNISPTAVRVAKYRVLNHLRNELEGLLE